MRSSLSDGTPPLVVILVLVQALEPTLAHGKPRAIASHVRLSASRPAEYASHFRCPTLAGRADRTVRLQRHIRQGLARTLVPSTSKYVFMAAILHPAQLVVHLVLWRCLLLGGWGAVLAAAPDEACIPSAEHEQADELRSS